MIAAISAGGTNDIMSRLYARFFPKYLPGNPTMIVRNMPGADTIMGANYAYSAKPDGLTLLNCSKSVSLNQLLGKKIVKYDLLKMSALLATATSAVFYIRSGIISKPEDILKAKGLVFGQAPSNAFLAIAAKEVLGFPLDLSLIHI